jgi:hypothetical protein
VCRSAVPTKEFQQRNIQRRLSTLAKRYSNIPSSFRPYAFVYSDVMLTASVQFSPEDGTVICILFVLGRSNNSEHPSGRMVSSSGGVQPQAT